MFRTSITSTPFTTDIANGCFENIAGYPFGRDVSFLATLRALVAPRIADGEYVELIFGNSMITSRRLAENSNQAGVRLICDNYDMNAKGQLIIHSLNASHEDNLANFSLIESAFTSVFGGYQRNEMVGVFYKQSFGVDCYINQELKSAIVFVERLENRRLHYLQVSIPKCLPWYFGQGQLLEEDELSLLKSLLEKTEDDYQRCISKLASKYDFRTARIRSLLGGIETTYEREALENDRARVRHIEAEIQSLNSRIGDHLKSKNDLYIRIMGLEKKIAEGGDSEIMDYFMCNKSLILDSVDSTCMTFTVKSYLEYFDREIAKTIINNPDSDIYYLEDDRNIDASDEGMKMLLNEIFVSEDPRLKIKTCAAFRLDLRGNCVPVSHHSFGPECDDCVPNTHIDRYACMGNYVRVINELMDDRDYIGAIEQCVASCKSLNWADGAVTSSFVGDLWSGDANNRCIELPDGNVVDPDGAISWLKQQEEGGSEQTEEETAGKAEENEQAD